MRGTIRPEAAIVAMKARHRRSIFDAMRPMYSSDTLNTSWEGWWWLFYAKQREILVQSMSSVTRKRFQHCVHDLMCHCTRPQKKTMLNTICCSIFTDEFMYASLICVVPHVVVYCAAVWRTCTWENHRKIKRLLQGTQLSMENVMYAFFCLDNYDACDHFAEQSAQAVLPVAMVSAMEYWSTYHVLQ